MSIQATIKVNPSLKQKMRMVEDQVEDLVRKKLTAIAQTTVDLSPVDTGAYVTSHSLQANSGTYGRGKSSANKPSLRNNQTAQQAKKDEGFDNLMEDISRLDLEGMKKVTLRNDSPHAQAVEYKHGHAVYTRVRNIHG